VWVCVYVCMYISMYVCFYLYIYIYIRSLSCLFVYKQTYDTNILVYKSMCVYWLAISWNPAIVAPWNQACVCVCVCVCMYVCMYVCMCVCMCVYDTCILCSVYVYVYVHVYVYVYAYYDTNMYARRGKQHRHSYVRHKNIIRISCIHIYTYIYIRISYIMCDVH
jgi:hypothetical protein